MKSNTEHGKNDTKSLILLNNREKILLFGINEMLAIQIIYLCKYNESLIRAWEKRHKINFANLKGRKLIIWY